MRRLERRGDRGDVAAPDLALTDEGEVLAERGRAILDALGELDEALAARRGDMHREVEGALRHAAEAVGQGEVDRDLRMRRLERRISSTGPGATWRSPTRAKCSPSAAARSSMRSGSRLGDGEKEAKVVGRDH
jgi:hypothetical protein